MSNVSSMVMSAGIECGIDFRANSLPSTVRTPVPPLPGPRGQAGNVDGAQQPQRVQLWRGPPPLILRIGVQEVGRRRAGFGDLRLRLGTQAAFAGVAA